MVLVDTSAFVAVLDRHDAWHADAKLILERLVSGREGLLTHNYVAGESIALVQRRFGMAAVADLTTRLFPMVEMNWVTPTLHAAGLSALLAAGQRDVSLVDQVSFEVMRRQGIERAFAFDADFVAAGFELLSA